MPIMTVDMLAKGRGVSDEAATVQASLFEAKHRRDFIQNELERLSNDDSASDWEKQHQAKVATSVEPYMIELRAEKVTICEQIAKYYNKLDELLGL